MDDARRATDLESDDIGMGRKPFGFPPSITAIRMSHSLAGPLIAREPSAGVPSSCVAVGGRTQNAEMQKRSQSAVNPMGASSTEVRL